MTRLITPLALAVSLAATPALAGEVVIPFNLVDGNGIGPAIGTVKAEDSPQGLVLTPSLAGLPPGPHGFHVHEFPSCQPKVQNGVLVSALAAGGHYDPDGTKAHLGPMGNGHRGDLPVLEVAADSGATRPVLAPRLTVQDLAGRSIVIHAGGDNYSDHPKPMGGGGARIACAVVPTP